MSSSNALFLFVAVLLPLAPAYLLYRLLPSDANVEGPWQGLKIKVSGAFGGYFLLVITIFGYSMLMPSYDVWTVSGHMSFADGSRVVDDRAVRFTVRPPNVQVQPGGDFRLTLVSAPDPAGYGQFPLLILEHADYQPIGIDLQRQGTRSTLKRMVVLRDTLVLQPLPRIAEGDGR